MNYQNNNNFYINLNNVLLKISDYITFLHQFILGFLQEENFDKKSIFGEEYQSISEFINKNITFKIYKNDMMKMNMNMNMNMNNMNNNNNFTNSMMDRNSMMNNNNFSNPMMNNNNFSNPMMNNSNPMMNNNNFINPMMNNNNFINPMMMYQMSNNNSNMINMNNMNLNANFNQMIYFFFYNYNEIIGNFILKLNNLFKCSLEYKYIEPFEIKNENDKITSDIKEIVYKNFLKENQIEPIENQLAGEFLYSIGGIARKSLELSYKIFFELYQEFNGNFHHNNRSRFSTWAKNQFNDLFFQKYSFKYKKEISKYLNLKHINNDTLIQFFNSLLRLYLKCNFSIPLVEVSFKLENNNDEFQYTTMDDIIYKGKPTKVNFCYLPQLKSNGCVIPGGNFYVFTYIEGKTYKKEKIDYQNDEPIF